VLGDPRTDDGTQPLLAARRYPSEPSMKDCPMPASPLPSLMTGVAQRTIASDRSLWRDLDPGRPHAHLRVDAMQGRWRTSWRWRA
jgi:hypothetical protein